MESPLISVIIPVYNTAAYIHNTLQSICSQTLKEIEIIVINDGSTDNSLEIIAQQACQDQRIQVYNQPNQGPSISRNKGIQKAKGEFLYFMDSDDILSPETLEVCYRKCLENQLDFVFFDAEILNKDHSLQSVPNYKRAQCTDENRVYDGNEILNILLDHWGYSASVCLNVINRNYLLSTHNFFHPHIIHEDELFMCLLYLQAHRVMSIHRSFFKRRLRSNSIMTRKFAWKNIEGYLTVTNELLNYQKKQDINIQQTIDKYLSIMLNAVIWNAHTLPFKEKIRLLRIGLKKYRTFIRVKNWFVLFLK